MCGMMSLHYNSLLYLQSVHIPAFPDDDSTLSLNRYVPVKTCLHTIPSGIEERGSEWPEEWPNRLEKYPDWLKDKDRLIADTKHWKDIVDKSYLIGLGIDWSSIRNVMDMKAIYGG